MVSGLESSVAPEFLHAPSAPPAPAGLLKLYWRNIPQPTNTVQKTLD